MMPRHLLNLGLGVVLLGLAGLIWFLQQPPPVADVDRLTSLMKADMQRIEIRPARHADARLERRGDGWWLVEPFVARADETRINAVAGLAQARSLARYAASAVDAKQAGLAKPDLRLRINDTTLTFGSTEPINGRRFVRVGDTVHLIVDRYSYLLQGGVASLVSPQLLAADEKLRDIHLPGLHLQLQGGRWQIVGGEVNSTDALHALVDAWQHARALKVSRVSKSAEDNKGDIVSLQIVGGDVPLRFVLQRDEDEVRLIREDLGLVYHFTPSAAERLFTLPSPEDESGGA